MTTREIIPKMDFGKSKVLCVISPNSSAQSVLQHVDVFEETVLKNALGTFSTVDVDDPELCRHIDQYQTVILMGSRPLEKFFKGATMRQFQFTQKGRFFITPAPNKLATARAFKYFETRICPDLKPQNLI